MALVVREVRIRHALRRHGILLRKDRSPSIGGNDLGGYMLIDVDHHAIVRHAWTLEDCEEWLRGE